MRDRGPTRVVTGTLIVTISVLMDPTAAAWECKDMDTMEGLATVRQIYMDGFNSGDIDAVMAVHTAGTIHMPSGMESVTGHDGVRQLMQDSFDRMPPDFRFEFEPMEVRVSDDFAVERGVTKGTNDLPAGKYVLMYVREADGCWRIAWTITNSDGMLDPSGR